MSRIVILAVLAVPGVLLAAPSVISVQPAVIRAGSMNVHLVVEGQGFSTGSIVRLNGEPIPTAYLSQTRLRATAQSGAAEQPGSFLVDVFDSSGSSSSKAVEVAATGAEPVRIAIGEREVTISGMTPGGVVQAHGHLIRGIGGRIIAEKNIADSHGIVHMPYTYYPNGVDRGLIFAWDLTSGRWAVTAVNRGAAPAELPYQANVLRRDLTDRIVRVQSDRSGGTLVHLVPGMYARSLYAGGFRVADFPCGGYQPMDPRPPVPGDLLLEYELSATPWFRIARVDELADHFQTYEPTVSVRDVVVNEGVPVAGLSVKLDKACDLPVTVDYSIERIPTTSAMQYLPHLFGAAASLEDFVPATGTITFARGETDRIIPLVLLDDEHIEHPEIFMVRLSNAGNAQVGQGDALVTVRESDRARIVPGQTRFTEGASGDIEFILDREHDMALNVTLQIEHVTTNDADFALREIKLQFEPGSQVASSRIWIVPDSRAEKEEYFRLTGPASCWERAVLDEQFLMVVGESGVARRRTVRH